jgi:hypothetical protein
MFFYNHKECVARIYNHKPCVAQSVEHKALNLVVFGSNLMVDVFLSRFFGYVADLFVQIFFIFVTDLFIYSDIFFVFLTDLPLSTVLNKCHQIYHTMHLRNISNQRYKYLFTDRIRRSGKGRRVSVEYFFLVD